MIPSFYLCHLLNLDVGSDYAQNQTGKLKFNEPYTYNIFLL